MVNYNKIISEDIKNFEFNNRYKTIGIIAAVTILGMILRIMCCFWGYPYQLHADEPTVVENTIDMLARHSYEAFVYNRPDHFEIKCNAIIFQFFSWLKYGVPAYEAFPDHIGVFYVLARFFTAFFGTVLIPLMYIFLRKLSERNGKIIALVGMFFVAFSPIFIQHSAYATPDIPLTFITVLIAYISIFYLESGKWKYLLIISILTAVAITIKYPAAICCVYIAIIIIYRAVREKDYKAILKEGLLCVFIVAIGIFLIAPNLVTNIQQVIQTLKAEARTTHLGADGLGVWGNIGYYFTTIMNSMGRISIVPFIGGIACIIIKRKRAYMSMLLSILFLLCLGSMPLHWERWGIPMFIAYICIVAIGFGYIMERIEKNKNSKQILLLKVCNIFVIVVLIANGVISSCTLAKSTVTTDTRVQAMLFCESNNITKNNSIYEGYTPLATNFGSGAAYKNFISDGKIVKVKESMAYKQYYVLSSSFRNRYKSEFEKYPEASAIYNGLDESFELIYKIKGENRKRSSSSFINIYKQLMYLFSKQKYVGDEIYIYNLSPDKRSIMPYGAEGNYLTIQSNSNDENNKTLKIGQEEYLWTFYEKEKRVSISGEMEGSVLDVPRGVFKDDIKIGVWEANDGKNQKWTLVDKGEYQYIVTENNMALTRALNGEIIIRTFQELEEQRWIIVKKDISNKKNGEND